MTSVPTIDDNYIRSIYNDLSNMEVELDADPLRFGPKRLNGKVATCRRHLSRCQQIYLQLCDDLQRLNREHRRQKLDFDLALQDMLTNDPEVRAGRNVRDREAIATTRLRAEREAISLLEASQSDLDAVLSVVKAKREDLKDIQGRIRDQVKLCTEEINLGGKWGSAPPPDKSSSVDLDRHPRVNTRALEAMHETLHGVETSETTMSDLEAFVAAESEPDSEPIVESTPEPDPEPIPANNLVTSDELDSIMDDLLGGSDSSNEESIEEAIEKPNSILPEVEESPVPEATAKSEEIEDFFSDVDVDVQIATSTAAPVVEEIDLDDLIGNLP